MADLKSKLEYYLPREDERRKIARRGQQCTHLEHTYEKRLEMLLGAVFGGGKGFPMPEASYEVHRELESV